MEKRQKINLSNVVRKRAPKKYLIKILIYAIILIGLLIYLLNSPSKTKKEEVILKEFEVLDSLSF